MFYQGKEYTKSEILERVGSIHSIGGVKKYTLCEGFGKGCDIVEFRNGDGLRFLVNLDRCMDIIHADYCGKTLNWRSSAEEVNSSYYDEKEINWLYSFGGGLTATCGLMNVGNPCEFDGEEKPMHGRVGNCPASNVAIEEVWDGDDFIMSVKGIMRETRLFGCNYSLERKISCKMGENKIFLEDKITNDAFIKHPLEILYHMNCGFPLVDKDSYLVINSSKIEGRTPKAVSNIKDWNKLTEPQYNFEEECFFHDIKTEDGIASATIINPNLDLGLCVKFNKSSMPFFTEWKCMDKGQYVLGFEPANCHVMGMAWESDNGTLEYMEPGQVKINKIEMDVLTSKEEINLIK